MTTSEKQVIDAIRDDISVNVLTPGPAFSTWSYVEPRSLRPDVAPRWLVTYPVRTLHEMISTVSSYGNLLRVRVEWREEVFAGMEANLDDERKAEAALTTFTRIRERLETYGGGVPGIHPNDTAELFETHYKLDRNGMWAGYVLLDVELFAGPA